MMIGNGIKPIEGDRRNGTSKDICVDHSRFVSQNIASGHGTRGKIAAQTKTGGQTSSAT